MEGDSLKEEASEYEIQRRRNIQRNNNKLKDLGLLGNSHARTNGPGAPSPAGTTATTAASATSKARNPRQPTAVGPLRRSLRAHAKASGATEQENALKDGGEGGGRGGVGGMLLAQPQPSARKRPRLTEAGGAALAAKRHSALPPDSSRNLECDLDKLFGSYLGKLFDSTGKAAVMDVSSKSQDVSPRFSKYSGVTEWANAIFLWVNVGGGDYENLFRWLPSEEEEPKSPQGSAAHSSPHQGEKTPSHQLLQQQQQRHDDHKKEEEEAGDSGDKSRKLPRDEGTCPAGGYPKLHSSGAPGAARPRGGGGRGARGPPGKGSELAESSEEPAIVAPPCRAITTPAAGPASGSATAATILTGGGGSGDSGPPPAAAAAARLRMTWFAGSRHRQDSPVVQRMLQATGGLPVPPSASASGGKAEESGSSRGAGAEAGAEAAASLGGKGGSSGGDGGAAPPPPASSCQAVPTGGVGSPPPPSLAGGDGDGDGDGEGDAGIVGGVRRSPSSSQSVVSSSIPVPPVGHDEKKHSGSSSWGSPRSSGRGSGEPGPPHRVLLLCRLPGEPYVFCGQLKYVDHFPGTAPLRFEWELSDAARLRGAPDFQRVLGGAGASA